GQTVRRGQPLLTVTPDPAARSTYQQAQSAATLAQGELQRTEQMAAQHLATASQVATARKTLADAQSALAAQQALGGGDAQETVAAPDDGVVTTVSVTLGERAAAGFHARARADRRTGRAARRGYGAACGHAGVRAGRVWRRESVHRQARHGGTRDRSANPSAAGAGRDSRGCRCHAGGWRRVAGRHPERQLHRLGGAARRRAAR